MKRLYFLLLIIICIINCGCSINNERSNYVERNDKSVVVLAAYRHLAPGNKDGYYCSRILGVWEPLITRDEKGIPAQCLAESWEMRESGKVWDFHLRRNVLFHDNTLFNADAVISNFKRLEKGVKRSNYYTLSIQSYYPGLEKYEKIDEYTVRLTFKEPNINQIYKMTDFGSPIYAPSCFDNEGNFKSVAIGTGPYKILKNELGKYVVLSRNESYYRDKAHIDRIIVRNIPSADIRFSALKSGEIDGVIDLNAIPPFLAEEAKKDPQLAVQSNKSTMIRYLALNNKKFPFNDIRMRQALSMAIDRNALIDALYMGCGKPTRNVLNYTSVGYKEYENVYDLEKARELAKEVLGNRRYKIKYCINGAEPLQKGEAELIAYWLSSIGLDVEIQSLEYSTRQKQMRKGDYDIARLQKGLANSDPYDALYSFLMPNGGLNLGNNVGYHNEEIIALMNKVKHIVDENERQQIFDRIQEIAVEEQPVVPLFNDVNIVAYNKRLKNYKPLIYGVDLSKVELVKEND